MRGVRAVDVLDPDGSIFVRLAEEVDLDDLLLYLLGEGYCFEIDRWEEPDDFPTRLGGVGAWGQEVTVGRFRVMPCICGEGHSWDVMQHNEGQSERGTFLGVMVA